MKTPVQFKHNGNDVAVFVQDDWRISSALTLNLGLRYELDTDVKNISRYDEINPLVTPFLQGDRTRDGNNVGVALAGVPQPFTTSGNNKDGYTVGAGLEYLFAPNWSAKAEYQYYNFGNTTITSGPADTVGARFRNDEHSVKLGVNYRFGWGGPAPSRY